MTFQSQETFQRCIPNEILAKKEVYRGNKQFMSVSSVSMTPLQPWTKLCILLALNSFSTKHSRSFSLIPPASVIYFLVINFKQ